MTDLQTAAKALIKHWDSLQTADLADAEESIEALRQALDQLPDTTKMIEPIIAGVVYDFAGFITTRNKVIRVGATADAAPVADLIKEWANRRSLSLENAAVGSWEKALAEPPNSTTDVVEPIGEIVEAQGLIGVSIPTMPSAGTKLYASLPQREWVGLTEEDIAELRRNGAHSVSDADFRAIEARLKELNT